MYYFELILQIEIRKLNAWAWIDSRSIYHTVDRAVDIGGGISLKNSVFLCHIISWYGGLIGWGSRLSSVNIIRRSVKLDSISSA